MHQLSTYIITASAITNKRLSHILFSELPFNAQIGVLGNELGHASEFNTKNTFQFISLFFKMFSSKFTDRFEFNTDFICINHGLGYHLYDWSKFVLKSLNIEE